jgi:hypothetical protein
MTDLPNTRPLYTASQPGVRIPRLALPLRVTSTGRLGVVEQGSTADLAQRVGVLCVTPPGWVDGRPGCGLYDQAFAEGGADLGEVERQITTWVPEAAALASEDPSLLAQAVDVLGLQVSQR